MSGFFSGIKVRFAAELISGKIGDLIAKNPIPKDLPPAQLAELKKVADRFAARAPDVAKSLKDYLPEDPPARSKLTPEVRTAVAKLVENVSRVLPGDILKQITGSAGANPPQLDERKLRDRWSDAVNYGLPAIAYVKDDLSNLLVAWAANHGITAAQLGAFEGKLNALAGLIPLLKTVDKDLAGTIATMDQRLTALLAVAAAPAKA